MLDGKRNATLTGFLIATFLTACAAATVIGAGCSVYREARLEMPEVTASGEFLQWFNALDAAMFDACS